MWDYLETFIGIIILFIFTVLFILLFTILGIAFLPIFFGVILVVGIIYVIDSIRNLILICKGKDERHLTIQTYYNDKEKSDKNNEQGRKNI